MSKTLSNKSNLQVLYEDNHIIVINKRIGDIVQGVGAGEDFEYLGDSGDDAVFGIVGYTTSCVVYQEATSVAEATANAVVSSGVCANLQ